MGTIPGLIVALDFSTLEEADTLVRSLEPFDLCYKIGLQLITAVGVPAAVKFLHDRGASVFLDGKFHDIPNTMGEAAAAAAGHGVAIFNVHAAASFDSMKAAAVHKGKSILLAVTVLTSHEHAPADKVLGYARDAKKAGCDGIICSGRELPLFATQEFAGFFKVTPGIRPAWASHDDQQRVITPAQAILAGAAALVIGRPITKPPQEIGTPADAAEKILEEMNNARRRRVLP